MSGGDVVDAYGHLGISDVIVVVVVEVPTVIDAGGMTLQDALGDGSVILTVRLVRAGTVACVLVGVGVILDLRLIFSSAAARILVLSLILARVWILVGVVIGIAQRVRILMRVAVAVSFLRDRMRVGGVDSAAVFGIGVVPTVGACVSIQIPLRIDDILVRGPAVTVCVGVFLFVVQFRPENLLRLVVVSFEFVAGAVAVIVTVLVFDVLTVGFVAAVAEK